MAWGMLRSPGSAYGPCKTACAHHDCADQRRWAMSVCRYCGQAIGYERQFCADPAQQPGEQVWVHFACALAAEEALP